MRVGTLTAAVSPDGRSLDLTDAHGSAVASLTFAVPGDRVAGWESDEEELLLAQAGSAQSRLRVVESGEAFSLHLTVDNLGPDPVELPYLGLGVSLADGWAGWAWTTDLAGLIAITSARDGRGGVLVRLRQGFLRGAREVPVFLPKAEDAAGRGAFHLSPPGALLGGHRRHAVTLDVTPLRALTDAAALLPPWLPRPVEREGTEITLSLPDQAVVPGPGVSSTLVGTDLVLTLMGSAGHREVAIHGRGVQRLRLTWHPMVADLLPPLVDRLTRRRPGRGTEGAGFVVVEAVVRSLAPDRERALDWLDQTDWLERGSLLGDVTAGVLAAVQGERRQLEAAWLSLARRPVTPGFGLAVMRLWLATLSSTGEPPSLAHELLARRAPDAASGLELALLSYRSADALAAPLGGLINTLGGSLPGGPIGLSASDAALAVSLLKLCPENWGRSREASEAAGKAEGLLLGDLASALAEDPDGLPSLDGLAWLLLGELGI